MLSVLRVFWQPGKEWNGSAGRVKSLLFHLIHVANCAWLGWRSQDQVPQRLIWEFGCSFGADGLWISEVVDTPITGCSVEFCLPSPIPHSKYEVI